MKLRILNLDNFEMDSETVKKINQLQDGAIHSGCFETYKNGVKRVCYYAFYEESQGGSE